MFFSSIQKLLAGAQAVTVIMVPADENRVAVTVSAKFDSGKSDPVLAKPISLIGTVAELDAEFGDLISNYAGVRKTLAEQLAAATAELEATKKATLKKPAATPAKAVVPATPQSVSLDDLNPENDPDDEGNESEEVGGSGEAQSASTQEASPAGGLDLASLL